MLKKLVDWSPLTEAMNSAQADANRQRLERQRQELGELDLETGPGQVKRPFDP